MVLKYQIGVFLRDFAVAWLEALYHVLGEDEAAQKVGKIPNEGRIALVIHYPAGGSHVVVQTILWKVDECKLEHEVWEHEVLHLVVLELAFDS